MYVAQMTERLAKTTMTDVVASVVISNSIRKAGVDGDAFRQCITLLFGVKNYDDKLLNNISKLTSKERVHLIAMLLRAYFMFNVNHVKGAASTKHTHTHTHTFLSLLRLRPW